MEAAVKIAQALGVSVEYLVTGRESSTADSHARLSREAQTIARQAELLSDKNRKFVIDFIRWIKSREGTD